MILNCDYLEGFKNLDDNTIDLIYVDPPYNIGVPMGYFLTDIKLVMRMIYA